MQPNFNDAAQSFEQDVIERFANSNLVEAGIETVRLEMAAKRLKLALETYISDLKAITYAGRPTSDAVELARLIIDYDQDDVGHKAADVLRAALEIDNA